MASSADVDAWKRLGGTVKELQKDKVWVAADGEEYLSWTEASKHLEGKSMGETKGKAASKTKRASASEAPKKANKKAKTNGKEEGASAQPAQSPASRQPGKAEAAGEQPSTDDTETASISGRGSRRAATKEVNYAVQPKIRAQVADRVAVKEESAAESEAAALADLSEAASAGPHRLADFEVHERGGDQQPLERLKHAGCPLFVTGTIFKAQGKMAKGAGKRVACFGPVISWHICCDGAQPEVRVRTEAGEYTCTRAANSYKAKFGHLQEQAAVLHEVVHGLDPKHKGNNELTIEEAAARLARAKVGKSYASPRAALVMNANFLVEQLLTMGLVGSKDHPFAASLLDAAASAVAATQLQGGAEGITLRDRPAAAGPAQPLTDEELRLQADTDYALQMQAKLDAQDARSGPGRRQAAASYIRISESEIADDYPEPQQYSKVEDETDELLLMDEDAYDVDPEQLPRRVLSEFAVYNAEGFMSSLELLPMWGGVDPDVQLYASGRVLDDQGDWTTGQGLSDAPGQEGAGAATEGGAGASSGAQEPAGMVLFLSEIKEWVAEFGCDMLRISIRTDVAWYCLDQPTQQYRPWFATVLKCARLAVHVLGMLTEEARASRLSFADVIKRISALDAASPVHISAKAPLVERFLVVHGQVVLNQFKHYPVKAVRDAAFVPALRERMAQRRHSKLYAAPKAKQRSRVNANPMRDRAANRAAPMTATATKMVKAIWASYFKPGEAAAAAAEATAGAPAVETVEGDEADEDDAAEEDALAAAASPKPAPAKAPRKEPAVQLLDPPKQAAGLTTHRKAQVGDISVELGAIVEMPAEAEDALPALGLLQAMWKTKSGAATMQVRVVVRGADTVLGDAASAQELFMTTQLLTSLQHRNKDWARAAAALEAQAQGQAEEPKPEEEGSDEPASFILRSLYLPEQGMFRQMDADLQLGQRLKEPEEVASGIHIKSATTLMIDGQSYTMGDTVHVEPCTFDQLLAATQVEAETPDYVPKGRYHKGGSNSGLRAMGIARLVSLPSVGSGVQPKQVKRVEVQRFYRPEDISRDQAYKAGLWDVYASDEKVVIDLASVVGPCQLAGCGAAEPRRAGDHAFVCIGTFQRDTNSFAAPPAEFALDAGRDDNEGTVGALDKGKGKAKGKGKGQAASVAASTSAAACRNVEELGDGVALKTMDIFAGCGGLSEGMHQAKAADTRWAIEYESPAADAFKLNHPHAAVFAANCNVILAAAMSKAGQQACCAASEQALVEAAKLPSETLDQLPAPGEVDFLCGGPPCQGYSGMNRFNKGNWSQVQNSMVMAYLSFADFYRPRYFLLENVRNFVSHNKSFTFRLTLRSLLDMGYQVRFGVLNAGNFGVSQSRKRTFIWGVAPGSPLPDWPALLHVFRSPQLTINLPGGVQYTAVRQDAGAPLRAVTVRDAIADLPAITNGSSVGEMAYTGAPVSAFQHSIRGGATVLRDHICKEMNALNLQRCRCIPKNVPGADWRVLQQLVAEDPSKELYQGQALVPWCLPNTADRHNGWRGLFGRLDWQGHFPTSTTDPQPMGKVGQVFHPDQDRIVSVRECARAQGFPDDFCFSGNVHNRHRQIGNAVPPPLAAALGRQLRQALEDKAAADAEQLMAAQLAALA